MDDVLHIASRNRAQIILGLCALGVIIGSLGPWAHIVLETISGVAGDGQLTLFLGVFTGAFTLLEVFRHTGSRARYISLTVAFFLAGLIGLNVWLSVGSTIAQGGLNASVGWGLQLMTVAAFIGGTVAYLQVKAISREKRRQRRLRREEEEAIPEIERAKQL
ncbi:MAG: hypothetical protein H0V47_01830 [Chloroflexia bacterium]|nr:hypothetical protein [Chloroflexia bacterium]